MFLVISRDGEVEAGGGGGTLFRKIERVGGGEGPPPASQQALDMSAFFSEKHRIFSIFKYRLCKIEQKSVSCA